jgi:redox-sensitive bicupin YhaK (pirin superfamily)
MFYLHWDLAAGARAGLQAEYAERALYVVSGAVQCGGLDLKAGEMAVLTSGKTAVVDAVQPSIVLALGGEPLGQRYIEWNFVSSSKERIEQAKADWRAGRMKLPDLDNGEFMPLPGDPSPPANPMS